MDRPRKTHADVSLLRGRRNYSRGHNALPLFDRREVLTSYIVSSRDLELLGRRIIIDVAENGHIRHINGRYYI